MATVAVWSMGTGAHVIANLVLGAASVSFGLALLPSILGESKPSVATSALTAFWLWVTAVVYLVTLSLSFAAVTTAVTAALWTVLLVQTVRHPKNRRARVSAPNSYESDNLRVAFESLVVVPPKPLDAATSATPTAERLRRQDEALGRAMRSWGAIR